MYIDTFGHLEAIPIGGSLVCVLVHEDAAAGRGDGGRPRDERERHDFEHLPRHVHRGTETEKERKQIVHSYVSSDVSFALFICQSRFDLGTLCLYTTCNVKPNR